MSEWKMMGQTSESLDLNGRSAFLSAGLALSVIASRCHLSQSERFWMYRNVCLLEKAPPLGELDAVRRPERASPAEGTLRLCLAQRTARQRGLARRRRSRAFV